MSAAEDAVRLAEAAVVRPGDTLVLALSDGVSPRELRQFLDTIEGKLPEGVKSFVVAGDIHLYVLHPGEVGP